MIDLPTANTVRVTPAEDLLSLAAALVGVPSESLQEAELAELVAERLADRAPSLTITTIGENVIARTQLGCEQRVLFGGHLDTVPANDNAIPRIERETLFGLGSCDMKGGLAVMLRLAESVHAAIGAGTPPSRDVTFVWYAAEEIADEHNGLRTVIAADPALLHADLAVLLEPTSAELEAGCQGNVNLMVVTRGARAHTARPWMGENAIHKAARIIERIAAHDPGTVEVDGLAYRQSMQVVRVEGGVANNVVPDECRITINRRIAPTVTVADALALVCDLAGSDADRVEVLNASEAAPPNLSNPIVAEFVAAVAAPVHPKLGWTDVARFHALGVPACNFGPGDPTIAHTQGEFVRRSELDAAYASLASFLGLT